MFCEVVRSSIGSHISAKSLELKHPIKLIQELTIEIDEIKAAIKRIINEEIQSPILTILSISYWMCAMIIVEIGNFSRFDSADKILAYVGLSHFSCLFHAYLVPCLYPNSICLDFQILHLYTPDTSAGNRMTSHISLFLSQANHFFP